MKWRKGPRPWTITVFALAFLAGALLRLIEGLWNLPNAAWRMADWLGPLAQSQDAVIVALFTEFTIALIPVVWIYGLGSGIARWIVLGFGLYKLLGFRMLFTITSILGPIDWWIYVEPLLIVLALAMLLSPSAGGYLTARKQEGDPETLA